MDELTRIGLGSFGVGPGSVTLPEDVTLACPQCETLVADKGQCIANFESVPDEHSPTGFVLKVLIDCRNCGCTMLEPVVHMK